MRKCCVAHVCCALYLRANAESTSEQETIVAQAPPKLSGHKLQATIVGQLFRRCVSNLVIQLASRAPTTVVERERASRAV